MSIICYPFSVCITLPNLKNEINDKYYKLKKTTLKTQIYISLLKQIETANICLNAERNCISVILDHPLAKVGPPWRKILDSLLNYVSIIIDTRIYWYQNLLVLESICTRIYLYQNLLVLESIDTRIYWYQNLLVLESIGTRIYWYQNILV